MHDALAGIIRAAPEIALLEIFIPTIQFFDACIIQNSLAVV